MHFPFLRIYPPRTTTCLASYLRNSYIWNMKLLYLAALLVISFGLSTGAHAQTQEDTAVLTKVEITPCYPGGEMAWRRYLKKNLVYPDADMRNGTDTVVVQFIVARDGTVTNIRVVSGSSPTSFRKEAIRLIKKSGLWTPGIQNGQQVRCLKMQPILFVPDN
jgi:TonB family protein